jgi:hypothetical protein
VDLIPAHLADGEDERYGRCVTCGRVARWWNDPLRPCWVHVIGSGDRFVDFPEHAALVAG